MLAALLERSALERLEIARRLGGRGVYPAAAFHASVAVRLKLQSLLARLEPGMQHNCSSLATLARLKSKAREAGLGELLDRLEAFSRRWGRVLACLDNVYRMAPQGCGSFEELYNLSLKIYRELEEIAKLLQGG